MNRQDIKALAAVGGYPCLTITLPTHRTSPDNRQDPIRLKNLVAEAAARLSGELGRREAESVLRRLEGLADQIEHQHNLDGLALFVADDVARAFRLPFSLPERVVVGESFFLRDLVYAYNRSPHYWVLALSEQPTRLFEAVRDDLEELTAGSAFPMAHGGPGGARGLPNDPAINASQLRDEHHRSFFREVDQALGAYMADDPQPLALVGVDRYLAFFGEVTSHGDAIVATIRGNHDQTSAHELGKLVWPPVREALAEQRRAIFDRLNAAVGGQRSASTLGEVWRFAQEGRGQTLVVEEGYHEAAALDETGMRLLPAGDGAGPRALDDAVDEVIAAVLDKGGRVVFVDDGTLAAHSRIALILRY
ncbi:MAG TPA: hypothetical protein PKD53_22645 [Chloroflexaceae bacterium]|nr:hypothetical protein [Chloroflexaceae bacterium]